MILESLKRKIYNFENLDNNDKFETAQLISKHLKKIFLFFELS